MKLEPTTESTTECKRVIERAFDGLLPKGFVWTSTKKRGVINWALSDETGTVIALVTNSGMYRTIELVNEKFTVKSSKQKPKNRAKKNPSTRREPVPQFPPPFRPTLETLDKLVEKFDIHNAERNPDPEDCPTCGLRYRDFKTGFDFSDIRQMLWVNDDDYRRWRQKGRHTVLGLWFEIKRSMWRDHREMCKKPKKQAEYLAEWEEADFEY